MKINLSVYFTFLVWLLENLKLCMWLAFVAHIIFILGSIDLERVFMNEVILILKKES